MLLVFWNTLDTRCCNRILSESSRVWGFWSTHVSYCIEQFRQWNGFTFLYWETPFLKCFKSWCRVFHTLLFQIAIQFFLSPICYKFAQWLKTECMPETFPTPLLCLFMNRYSEEASTEHCTVQHRTGPSACCISMLLRFLPLTTLLPCIQPQIVQHLTLALKSIYHFLPHICNWFRTRWSQLLEFYHLKNSQDVNSVEIFWDV